jgi:hypothetical protein
MATTKNTPTDTPQGVTRGAGGKTGPDPKLRKKVVSGDRNTGEASDKLKRRGGETPRDKPVEEEADKDIKEGGEGAQDAAKKGVGRVP